MPTYSNEGLLPKSPELNVHYDPEMFSRLGRISFDETGYRSFLLDEGAPRHLVDDLQISFTQIEENEAALTQALSYLESGDETAFGRVRVIFGDYNQGTIRIDWRAASFVPNPIARMNDNLLHETGHFVDDTRTGELGHIAHRSGRSFDGLVSVGETLTGFPRQLIQDETFELGHPVYFGHPLAVLAAGGISIASSYGLMGVMDLSIRSIGNPLYQRITYKGSRSERFARKFADLHAEKSFISAAEQPTPKP